jgi:primosomal protein N' (replication factor Y)
MLTLLLEKGYAGFAARALAERAAAHWPPFARLAVLRASDTSADGALRFLRAARETMPVPGGVLLRGPVPAAMHRRADRYHALLLVERRQRARLQEFLHGWVPAVEALRKPHSLRWALDVDPLEVM